MNERRWRWASLTSKPFWNSIDYDCVARAEPMTSSFSPQPPSGSSDVNCMNWPLLSNI